MIAVTKPSAAMAYRLIPTLWQGGLAVVLAGALAACGTRGTIALVDPAQAQGGAISSVIVATSRAPAAAPEYYSGKRDFETHYASFEVSVPPDRKPGTIRYPKAKPDPRRDFVATDARRLDGPRAFVTAINAEAAKLPRNGRKGTFFVHGFNSNFAEGVLKSIQLRHDLKSPGLGVVFTWPSVGKLLGYVADRENALFSRQPLAETLSLMARTNLDSYNLVAHSMGAFLTMETLLALAQSGDQATLNKINAVILISADIEIDVFRREAPAVLAAGVPIYLIVSSSDKALKFSSKIRGESDRVGSVRSKAELGGLDIPVIDVSQINSDDALGHLVVGTSPEVIAFVQQLRKNGIAIFDDDQKVGILEQGGALIQGATGVILNPITN